MGANSSIQDSEIEKILSRPDPNVKEIADRLPRNHEIRVKKIYHVNKPINEVLVPIPPPIIQKQAAVINQPLPQPVIPKPVQLVQVVAQQTPVPAPAQVPVRQPPPTVMYRPNVVVNQAPITRADSQFRVIRKPFI